MNKRRSFLNQLSLIAGTAVLTRPMAAAASISKQINTIYSMGSGVTIYHTNDLHGNISPVVGTMGGLDQVKTLLKNQDTDGLLLDAGDFLNDAHSIAMQKETIYAMNNLGYVASTPGNHELSNGQDALAKLVPLMRFELVNCNYRFDDALSKLIKPYIITNSGKFKIGITGVGHQLNNIKYTDAIQSANNIARLLKEKEKCDLVICLSHLGYSQKGDMPDNQKLAMQSENIDLIISGHNRTLLRGQAIKPNKLRQEVIISQAAWDGLMMGKVVFNFGNGKQKNNIKAENLIAGQPYEQSFAASFAELRTIEKRLVSA